MVPILNWYKVPSCKHVSGMASVVVVGEMMGRNKVRDGRWQFVEVVNNGQMF